MRKILNTKGSATYIEMTIFVLVAALFIAFSINLSYSVDTSYFSGKKIQLGTPFKVKVTAKAYLGGFGAIHLFPVELVSSGAGISEEYWK